MVSDVPLGAFLSGGIDSSAVVATMAQLSTRSVKTFSIGFREQDYDETRYARRVAQRFGTDHHELILESDITALVQDLAWYLDEPFGDPSAIPTYMVSKLTAEDVTVVLSGDGGDELFAGYDKYVVESREQRYQRVAAPVRALLRSVSAAMPEGATGRNFLRHFSLAGTERYLDALTLFQPNQRGQLFRSEVTEQIRNDDAWREATALLTSVKGDWLSALQYFDFKRYLPLDVLTKVDRMSMAHSIEVRVPLLDHKLVEFAASIPPEMKLRNGTTKYIFKQALRGILPDDVIDRRKQGFAVPWGVGSAASSGNCCGSICSRRVAGNAGYSIALTSSSLLFCTNAGARSTPSCGRCSRSSFGVALFSISMLRVWRISPTPGR